MASRYHWLAASFSQNTTVGNSVLPDLNIALPAGATLKRFITRGNFQGLFSGYDVNFLQPLYTTFQFQFSTGPNAGRIIHYDTRIIPAQYLALFDTTYPTNNRIYTQICNAGDLELAVNEKCSYGKASGAAANFQCLTRILAQNSTAPAHLTGNYQLGLRALYYL
jgi:hypothetical protein